MARKPRNIKRRVVRGASNSGTSTKISSGKAAATAKAAKKGNFWSWLVTPAVPRAKGIKKLAPDHIWKVISSKKALKLYAIGALSGILAVAAVFAWFAKDLPSPNKINALTSAQTTKLYDRTGEKLLVEIYGDKNRSLIEFNQMPQCIKDATVALEDKDFYKQGAFSPKGLARAFSGVLFRDSSRGGGSTITQQYVKNALLTSERSYGRKIKELILAIEIEQLYKKDDILKLYLNEIPYGSTAYGIQAASKQYFGIDAKDLSLSQCAMLASLPQAPTYYSPYGTHKDALIAKKDRVLDLMVEQKYITEDQAKKAKQTDVLAQLKPYNPYANVTAPHFVQYTRELLENKFGIKRVNEGGLKVITSLDYDKQKQAEDAVASNIDSVRANGGSNAALTAADPKTGEVLAMVGSYDYNNPEFGSYNVAVARRQPGSSIKPLVYSNLFKKNWGAGSTFYDVQTDFGGGYKPQNYTRRFYGVQSARSALASSLNIPAVKALYIGGIDEFIGTAKDMGITTFDRSSDEYGLSLALGSGEVKMVDMANAFSTLADNGQKHDQVYWLKVTDPSGKVVDENNAEKNKSKQVIDPQIASQITSILSDNPARCSLGAFSCNNPLTLGSRPVAAKTGTTEDYKDAWTVGYTPSIVTTVWAGNNNNKPMTQAASIVSAPIWNKFMKTTLEGSPVEQFTQAPGLKKVTLDSNTGKTPTEITKQTRTDIFPAWYSLTKADASQKGTIDKVSGKLATECTPVDARQEVTGGSMTAEIPSTDPSFKRWNPPVAALARSLGYSSGGSLPTDKDDVHQCGDTPPSISISATATGAGTVTVTANIVGGRFPVNRVDFYRNGGVISSQAIGAGGAVTISDSPGSGVHGYFAKVYDAGLYNAQSNSVSVNSSRGSGSPVLSCSGGPGSKSCSLTGITSGTAILYNIGGGSSADSTSPYGWNASSWPGAVGWNGNTGALSNIYVRVDGGSNIYP